MPALDPLLQVAHHVVAQVVEAEFVVGPVGDVALIGRAALGGGRLRVVDAPHRQAEPLEEMAHPLRVTSRQVVVHRDEMRAAPGQRIEIQRQGCDQRLAFAGGHFGDLALMQHDAADELHVVGHHVPFHRVPRDDDLAAQQAAGRFAHRRKRFGQQVVQRLLQLGDERLLRFVQLIAQVGALGGIGTVVLRLLEALDLRLQGAGALRNGVAEPGGLRLQLAVGDFLETHFVLVNRIHDRLDAFQLAVEPRPEDSGEPTIGHYTPSGTARASRCIRAPGRALNIEWNAPV